MAIDPEAQAQLARLLHNESLLHASPEEVQAGVEAGFDTLVAGLLAETAASDDVTDQATALSFLDLRLSILKSVLTDSQMARLYEAVRGKIASW